jgi:valyl-tRNA synthetase
VALAECGFGEAAETLYRFILNLFYDWYIELIKPRLNGADIAAHNETRAVTAWALDVTFKLLHPVMPFLTEKLWAQTSDWRITRAPGLPHDRVLATVRGEPDRSGR